MKNLISDWISDFSIAIHLQLRKKAFFSDIKQDRCQLGTVHFSKRQSIFLIKGSDTASDITYFTTSLYSLEHFMICGVSVVRMMV